MMYDKISAHSSIAASILTFALTMVEFSDLTLSKWWHFVLAFLTLILCFILCLIAIEITLAVLAKYKRPGPKVDFKKEYADIEQNVHAIYQKDIEFTAAVSTEYKKIISKEILLLCRKLKKDIDVYLKDYRNPVLKKRPQIPDERLFELYKEYCEGVIAKYEPNS